MSQLPILVGRRKANCNRKSRRPARAIGLAGRTTSLYCLRVADDIATCNRQVAHVNRTAAAVLVLIIIGAAVSIYVTLGKQRARLPAFAQVDLGQVLAEETAKRLGSGGQIVIVTRDPAEVPAAQGQLSSFQKTISRHTGVTVAATRTVKFSEMTSMCRMPARVYFELLQQHPKANVIVSLLGAPELSEAEISQLGRDVPKLVATSSCADDFKPLFDAGLLHLIIVPRRLMPAPDAAKPGNARELFEQTFEIVTP